MEACKPTSKLCVHETCNICFQRSFASHEQAAFWSDKNTLTPRMVCKSTSKRYWFQCMDCEHHFESPVANVTSKTQPTWCPYCAKKKLCLDVNCEFCHNNSFASHPRSADWHEENDCKPRDIFKSTGNSYTFKCDKCPHKFTSRIADISYTDASWCPFCSNQKLCSNDCDICLKKSFASHSRSQYWSVKNTKTPRDVFTHSGKKCWFTCDVCNVDFESKLSNVTQTERPTWCPTCTNKTESKLYTFLTDKYKQYTIKREAKFDWCRYENSDGFPRFDFYILELDILLELDGTQHFEQVSDWQDCETTCKNDVRKMFCAIKNTKSLIRIYQPDVYLDRGNWQDKLSTAIHAYNTPTVVYIASKNVYDTHQKLFATMGA